MWILPKNYQPSSVFAADTLESSEDLTLPGLNIESSLMWRSKPSPLQTWSLRWKRESWLRHLFGRILKPSQRTYFEAQLTLSLAVTLANRSARQVREQGQTIPDIFGQLFGDIHKQLDLLGSSLKMSKDILASDSETSLATWKKMVIEQRGEYLARVKLALHTKGNESSSLQKGWSTPQAQDCKQNGMRPHSKQRMLITDVHTWATPQASDHIEGARTAKESNQKCLGRDLNQMNGLQDQKKSNTSGKNQGSPKLNPDWVEQLMGLSTGWTDLGFWGTE